MADSDHDLHRLMAERMETAIAESYETAFAPVHEFCEWIEAHPDATQAERTAAHDAIRAKYPSAVEYDRNEALWEAWQEEHPDARAGDGGEYDCAHHDIWGFFPDPDDDEEDDDDG